LPSRRTKSTHDGAANGPTTHESSHESSSSRPWRRDNDGSHDILGQLLQKARH
jgi:hypothetical protein